MNAPHHAQNQGNDLFGNLQQMLTFKMLSSTDSNPDSFQKSIITMVIMGGIGYLFKVLPFFCQLIYKEITKYLNRKYKTNIESFTVGKQEKTSSITVTINFTESDNLLGFALADKITNHDKTKSICFRNKNFMLNYKEEIEIDQDVFVILKDDRVESESSGANKGSDNICQVIEIYSYGMNINELRKFTNQLVDSFRAKVQNKLGDKIFCFSEFITNNYRDMNTGVTDLSRLLPHFTFNMRPFFTNRSLKNMVGPEIDIVRTRVNFFLNNKKFYESRGIPYCLGLMLSGGPGTGKTSTIKAISKDSDRHIVIVNFHNSMTKTQLENLFFNDTIYVLNNAKTEQFLIPLDKRIYVLEDVDCQSELTHKRKELEEEENTPAPPPPSVNLFSPSGENVGGGYVANHSYSSANTYTPSSNEQTHYLPLATEKNKKKEEDGQKVNLSFLLNLLDGIIEGYSRIIIFTSNCPKMLDPALIRPGRIDLVCNYTKTKNLAVIALIEKFYGIVLKDKERDGILKFKEELWSPAELQQILFEHFHDYKAAIKNLEVINKGNQGSGGA